MADDFQNRETLRVVVAGNVDDGKSTLLGRLLFDSRSIFDDQLMALCQASEKRGDDNVNLALLSDALHAEQEQGITLDVAHHYFSTARRQFILIDTPGHIQHTRNMITGASTADLILMLIDARKGIAEQTRRHTFIASLLGIKHMMVAVNKMDLVDYREDIFELIRSNLGNFASKLDFQTIDYIPICALHGDNIVNTSLKMPWYKGKTLLNQLENFSCTTPAQITGGRFPVQYVLRPVSNDYQDYLAYAGIVAGGEFKTGQKAIVLPSKTSSYIKSINMGENSLEKASSPMSVSIQLTDDLDINRGDLIVTGDDLPVITQEFDAMIFWCSTAKLLPGNHYLLMQVAREDRCSIKSISYKIDINTGNKIDGVGEAGLNDIVRVSIKTLHGLYIDKYTANHTTGSLILIDETTNETVAAGMII
ncbi:MAG TPA: GTP-binding protein [Bacteroidales bacterium]|nr:GTP-binding protein [Bacteroidales bacterium]HQN15686.1 GTP-binding protein [Bacteroidales bacterium]HQP15157.1 GTP-binding protein [Bacteroidales bacterium]